jgi:transcriptional regulator with XRE-family HTH domain
MKKNKRFEEIRKSTPKEIDLYLTRSFDIVDRIYEILQLKNLDQKDLALLLGKKESEISKWMSGTHNFTLKTLAKIEGVLGAPIIKVISKEMPFEQRPTLFLVSRKYAQINLGNNILIGDLQDFEVKPMFQKPSEYLS